MLLNAFINVFTKAEAAALSQNRKRKENTSLLRFRLTSGLLPLLFALYCIFIRLNNSYPTFRITWLSNLSCPFRNALTSFFK